MSSEGIEEKLAEVQVADSGDAGKEEQQDDDVVNPWNVASNSSTGVDYDKLIRKLS